MSRWQILLSIFFLYFYYHIILNPFCLLMSNYIVFLMWKHSALLWWICYCFLLSFLFIGTFNLLVLCLRFLSILILSYSFSFLSYNVLSSFVYRLTWSQELGSVLSVKLLLLISLIFTKTSLAKPLYLGFPLLKVFLYIFILQ